MPRAVLLRMDPDEAADARRLREYDAEEAGGPDGHRVSRLSPSTARSPTSWTTCVATPRSTAITTYSTPTSPPSATSCRACSRLRDLLLAGPRVTAAELMIANPLAVDAEAPLDELADIFDRKGYFGLPVTEAGRLVGVVRRADVEQALGTRAEQDYPEVYRHRRR